MKIDDTQNPIGLDICDCIKSKVKRIKCIKGVIYHELQIKCECNGIYTFVKFYGGNDVLYPVLGIKIKYSKNLKRVTKYYYDKESRKTVKEIKIEK